MKNSLTQKEVEALLSSKVEIDRARLIEVAQMLDVEYAGKSNVEIFVSLHEELNQMSDEANKVLQGQESKFYPELVDMKPSEIESKLLVVNTLLIELTLSEV